MPKIRRPGLIAAGFAALVLLGPGSALGQQQGDTSFARMQERGRMIMGVDQYASTHRFDDLPDGGRIELQTDPGDSSSVRAIREHLARIAREFAAGDFSDPMLVHAETVPGTATMSARRRAIHYQFEPLAGGGEVRLVTRDPQAVRAIHAFLDFQRREHRAAGRHEH